MVACRDFVNGVISQAPKEMGKEVEACLEREIAGDAARVVRGDGTVESDTDPNDLSKLSKTKDDKDGGSTPGSQPSSDVEPSWEQAAPVAPASHTQTEKDPHIRDGTSVASMDDDGDDPESHINFKPRRRTPSAVDSTQLTPTITLLQPKPKNTSSNSRTQTYLPPKAQSTYTNTNTNAPERPPSPNVLTNNNGQNREGRGISRRQTYMQLSHVNSPTSPPSAMSPPVPSVRRRARATSHPDVFQLCQSWAELGPANDSIHIEAGSVPKRGT